MQRHILIEHRSPILSWLNQQQQQHNRDFHLLRLRVPDGKQHSVVTWLGHHINFYSEALPTQHGYCVGVSRRNATGNGEWTTCPRSIRVAPQLDSNLRPFWQKKPNLPMCHHAQQYFPVCRCNLVCLLLKAFFNYSTLALRGVTGVGVTRCGDSWRHPQWNLLLN